MKEVISCKAGKMLCKVYMQKETDKKDIFPLLYIHITNSENCSFRQIFSANNKA